ncbi:hypothetical protein LX36DRAFT_250472 [Colletotrichum falcatum]|nr:hypothetical protein LX36DRAFT_250472 [Colletotrichum falcatum]
MRCQTRTLKAMREIGWNELATWSHRQRNTPYTALFNGVLRRGTAVSKAMIRNDRMFISRVPQHSRVPWFHSPSRALLSLGIELRGVMGCAEHYLIMSKAGYQRSHGRFTVISLTAFPRGNPRVQSICLPLDVSGVIFIRLAHISIPGLPTSAWHHHCIKKQSKIIPRLASPQDAIRCNRSKESSFHHRRKTCARKPIPTPLRWAQRPPMCWRA